MIEACITDFYTLSPLGKSRTDFTKNLKNGNNCLSEIESNSIYRKLGLNFLGLLPGQLLLNPYEKLNHEILIKQKNNWVSSLIGAYHDHEESVPIDCVILIHNCGPNLITYNAQLQMQGDFLSSHLEAPFLTPEDFIVSMRKLNIFAKNVEIINFHNTCSSVSAGIAYASKKISASQSNKVMILSFETSNNNWATHISLNALGVLNQHSTEKDKAMLPFSKDRAGFIKADAIGYLILEPIKNSKNPIAKVLGYKISNDSYSLTDGVEDGSMVEYGLNYSLEMSGLDKSKIDYVNAHGSSTRLNDKIEAIGIQRAFGAHAENLLVSSTKSQFGHALCATGVVEISAVLDMFKEKYVAANINLHRDVNEDFRFNLVKHPIQNKRINFAAKNSFGFGGYNACLILENLS